MLPHVALPHCADELDAVLEHTPLAHLLELDELLAIAANHKAELRVRVAQPRDCGDKQIDPLAVHEPAQHDDADLVCGRRLRVWQEVRRHNGIRNCRHILRLQSRAKHRVLAPAVSCAARSAYPVWLTHTM